MADNKYLVLGTSVGYSQEQVRPFIRSCLEHIPNADLVLFTDDSCSVANGRFKVVCPDDLAIRRLIRLLPRGRRVVAFASLRLGMLLRRKALGCSKFLTGAFGVAVARYFWYRDWLKNISTGKYTHILLSDTRDVIFQSDPFPGLPEGSLFCGDEPRKMADCKVNSDWFRQAYGSKKLAEIGCWPILCSGVTGGRTQDIIDYLDKLCSQIMEIAPRILWGNGFDQAVHNFLLRMTPFGDRFLIEHPKSSRLITMHYMNANDVDIASDGTLRNSIDQTISIVHQYDRHPKISRWVADCNLQH